MNIGYSYFHKHYNLLFENTVSIIAYALSLKSSASPKRCHEVALVFAVLAAAFRIGHAGLSIISTRTRF